MSLIEIDKRYTALAEDQCCLSCGGAINFSEIKQGEICVDLGSGRGTDAIRMAEKTGKGGFVYGIDISEGMLKKARQNAAKLGIDNIEFIESNLEEIKIPDEKVDLIISNCTINHAAKKQKVWNEIYRILKFGGRFVISDIYSTSVVPEKFRDDAVAISECWGGAITRDAYMDILHKAGFLHVGVLEESKPYAKGEIEVCSFTIAANKEKKCCCN